VLSETYKVAIFSITFLPWLA